MDEFTIKLEFTGHVVDRFIRGFYTREMVSGERHYAKAS